MPFKFGDYRDSASVKSSDGRDALRLLCRHGMRAAVEQLGADPDLFTHWEIERLDRGARYWYAVYQYLAGIDRSLCLGARDALRGE